MVKVSKAKNGQDVSGVGRQGTIQAIAQGCTACGVCVRECAFLEKHGMPVKIAKEVSTGELAPSVAFECSLCGLCTALCPEGIDPASMFAHLRVQAEATCTGHCREHRQLLFFEQMGTSPLLSWYGLPQDCTTVFFPGCSLAGSRPERVVQVYEYLKTRYPSLGMVLDCCSAPSHILGITDRFNRNITALIDGLLEAGIHNILVACPTCYSIFSQYGKGMKISTIYQELASMNDRAADKDTFSVTVHDPCCIRHAPAVHEAVRTLIGQQGGEVEEMVHHGVNTICCGKGGAVDALAPEYSRTWARQRLDEADGRNVITYCCCCSGELGRSAPVGHVLDLIFDLDKRVLYMNPAASGIVSYLRRWRLRHRLSVKMQAVRTGRRTVGSAVKWLQTIRD